MQFLQYAAVSDLGFSNFFTVRDLQGYGSYTEGEMYEEEVRGVPCTGKVGEGGVRELGSL